MGGLIGTIYHYIHALESRFFQLYEVSLMPSDYFEPGFRRQIWTRPGQTEDWVNLVRFLEPREEVLLLDIGANVGDFTSGFLSIFKKGRSVCFEPVSSTYSQLSKRYCEDPRVDVLHYAVSNVDGAAKINLHEDSTLCTLGAYSEEANSTYQTTGTDSEQIECRRLDSLKFERGSGRLFVKIDVQGFEIEAIEGGMKTLALADGVLLECSFAEEWVGKEPSFAKACFLLRECGLYPIVLQDYGRRIANYAFERDVLFVRRELLQNIWLRNYSNIIRVKAPGSKPINKNR